MTNEELSNDKKKSTSLIKGIASKFSNKKKKDTIKTKALPQLGTSDGTEAINLENYVHSYTITHE